MPDFYFMPDSGIHIKPRLLTRTKHCYHDKQTNENGQCRHRG
jgi:hypothetical protein